MAPGLRSGRTGRTGHPKVVGAGGTEPGGSSPQRTDAAGRVGTCLRTRWKAGAAGMLANCLLSAGMLSLLAQCALAAEEKPTYDASGSSSLQSDPTASAALAAPTHPLADPSVVEEVPFSVVHSNRDSESEGGRLSGQPAFSSVLTVMAGTVKHPASLDQTRTSSTITRDETYTTQWPSHSSSQGSELFSSSLSEGDRIFSASSGLMSTTSSQAVSRSLYVSFMDGNRNMLVFPSKTVSLSSQSSNTSPSASSVSSSIMSLRSVPFSAKWINKAASSSPWQRVRSSFVPRTPTATPSPAGSASWTDSSAATQSTSGSAVDLTAVALQSTTTTTTTTTTSPYFTSDTREANTRATKTSAVRTGTLYSVTNYRKSLQNMLHGVTKENVDINSLSTSNHGIGSSFPTNQDTQAVQKQQGASLIPTSALLLAHTKGDSVSSHATPQMLHQTANETGVESQTFVQKSTRDTSPLSSHVVNPTVSPAMTFRPTGSFFAVFSQTSPGKTSLTKTAITELTAIHSGMVSSEHAFSPDDLLIAAGQRSPGDSTINTSYNQGEIAEAELTSISAHTHLNNSLSLTQPRPESVTGSLLGVITKTGASSLTSKLDSLDLQGNGVRNVQKFATQTWYGNGSTQESPRGSTTRGKPSSISRTTTLSGSDFSDKFANDIIYEHANESLLRTTWSANTFPYFLSHNPNPINANHNSVSSANSQVTFSGQVETHITPSLGSLQKLYLLTSPNKFYKSAPTPPPSKFHQTISSADIFPLNLKSERSSHSIQSNFTVATSEGNITMTSASDVHVTEAGSFHRNAAQSSASSLFDGNKESTLIRDTVLNQRGVPSGQFTTQSESFMTTKDFLLLKEHSEGSLSEIPFSSAHFDAALETSKSPARTDNVINSGLYEKSSPSSWSEIIQMLKTNSISRSPGSVSVLRRDKSNFYFGVETSITPTASSAPTTFPSDGQNGNETFSAIFSFGTKIMTPYVDSKPTNPVPFQSTASELESRSTGFDRENSSLQADGHSYEHQKLEGGQEHKVFILDSTQVATELFSLNPTVGEHPSSYAKGITGSKDQRLNASPANLRSAVAFHGLKGALVNTVAPSTRVVHMTTDSPTSSLAEADSLETESNAALSLSNNLAHNLSSENDTINNTADSEVAELFLPTELARPSLFHSTPSSTKTTYPAYTSVRALLLSSAYMKLTSLLHSKASSSSLSSSSSSSSSELNSNTPVSIKPTPFPDTGPSHMSGKALPASSSSSSLNVTSDSEEVTDNYFVFTETDELAAGTTRAVALTFPKEKKASLAPSQSAVPTERTSQVSPLPPRQDTTTASVKLATTTVASTTTSSIIVTTQSTATTTPPPAPLTRRTTTTVRTQTSRRTFTPPVPRTSPPRAVTTFFISPFTTTTETPPQLCNITERLWVKTVVSIYVRRNRLDSIQRQNLRRGLSQGLRKALNDSAAQAQVETVFGSPNMTVAYHVTGGDIVYSPSVVLEGLDKYGRDKLIADLRQYLPMVTALPLPVASWKSSPATGFQLKTVLQFVGAGDDPRSCRFSQMMEQRLQRVFSEAQAKVLNINSKLSVQILSVSQAAASPAVSLVYAVKNGTVFLNGTTASNLLGQLSAELVGYFLFYPPLIIAEPMEYHNLNTSIATRDFWVITVIQDVDNASLEGQYQSFARLMEQRLAELFALAGQQGTRFRRATSVGSYTVQMVSIRRVSGLKNPAEMTYYVQHNGVPQSGTSAAKALNTVDSQTMALTLGYFVQLQAEPVVKNPPNNLWILAAVLAPIAVVTLIIIIITAVLCRKNKNDFKADAIGNLNPRAKMAYRRDVGYYHQPVQGFDYAKQHLGQQGGDEETLPVSQDTLVMSLQIRDTPLSLEKSLQQDGTANKKNFSSDTNKSKLPSEDGSVISNESEKLKSGRGLTVLKVTAQQKPTKEEMCRRDDPYDTSSGSLQLISIKPMAAQPNYSQPVSSDRSQDSAIVNGEVNLALKQKSDIEHYRNKLRLKAKRKGYYDFPSADGESCGRAMSQTQRHDHERAGSKHGRPLEPDDERGSTYVKSHRRHSQVGQIACRSRQSLSSPSPGGTEMDLLVMRERPRRGIRNSGYDTEPELIEETNVDRLMGPRGYMYGRGLKGHSETSTLSSQPSIDEVRHQMHLLLEEAFSLASGGQSTSGRHSHHHHPPPPEHYNNGPPPLPYAEMVTSAPGTMSGSRGGLQWVPSYGADVYQCSLPKPVSRAFHFTQLPEMAMGSPPPLPPRTGPPPGTSLRRSTSDLGPKGRSSETSVTEMQNQHDSNPYGPTTRAALPSITAEQPVSNYSGNPITAVYAIPATRPGYSEYFVSTPPTSYHSPSWMSYPPEPEDVPPQWADSLPLPGYVEAFPHPRYPQGSPTRLPLQYNPAIEPPSTGTSAASKQGLPQVVKEMDSMPLSNLSTSALVQAIRQEVAKLAKKQNDVFEF